MLIFRIKKENNNYNNNFSYNFSNSGYEHNSNKEQIF